MHLLRITVNNMANTCSDLAAQARRSGNVDRAGRTRRVDHRSGADAIATGFHIDSPDLMFAVAVG